MTNDDTKTASDMPVRVLLAGSDTLYFSCDLPLSEAMRDQAKAQQRTQQTDRQAWHRFFREPGD